MAADSRRIGSFIKNSDGGGLSKTKLFILDCSKAHFIWSSSDIEKFSSKEFIKHLRFDKKVKNNKLKFILLEQYGKTLSYTLNDEKLLIKFLEKNLE